MNKLIKIFKPKFVQAILLAVVLSYITYYLFKHRQIFDNFKSVSPKLLVLLALTWVMIYLINGYRSKIFLAILGVKTTFNEWFGTTVIATMSNYLLPQSGLIAKGSYFKFTRKMTFCDYLATRSAEFCFVSIFKGVTGIILTIFLPLGSRSKLILIVSFATFVIMGLFPFALERCNFSRQNWLFDKIQRIVLGLKVIRKAKPVRLPLLAISALEPFSYAVWYLLGYHAIGVEITFFNAFVLGTLMSLTMLIPLTPGNLGIQEIIVATYSSIGKMGFEKGLAVSFLLRGVSLVMSFALGLFFSKKLLTISKTKIEINPMKRKDFPKNKKFIVFLSHDVDRVQEQWFQTLYYALRRQRIDFLWQRWQAIEENPSWNFDRILALEAKYGVKSTFFFLNESIKPNIFWPKSWNLSLGRYSLNEPKIRALIKQIDRKGWEIGLHGSYRSYKDQSLLKEEKKVLEDILGKPVIGVRQHYLNLEIPETWQNQQKAGLSYDASFGSNQTIGFKDQEYYPFHPFGDNFLVIPLVIMDTVLLRGGDIETVWQMCSDEINLAERKKAVLTVLWHNNVFNEDRFPGYGKIYERIIQECQSRNAWFATGKEIYRWAKKGQ